MSGPQSSSDFDLTKASTAGAAGQYTDLVNDASTLGQAGNVARFSTSDLLEIVAQETHNAQRKIESIQAAGSAISISDMFEMQMRMNRLSQYSEMSTAVVSAANAAISSIARNVK